MIPGVENKAHFYLPHGGNNFRWKCNFWRVCCIVSFGFNQLIFNSRYSFCETIAALEKCISVQGQVSSHQLHIWRLQLVQLPWDLLIRPLCIICLHLSRMPQFLITRWTEIIWSTNFSIFTAGCCLDSNRNHLMQRSNLDKDF